MSYNSDRCTQIWSHYVQTECVSKEDLFWLTDTLQTMERKSNPNMDEFWRMKSKLNAIRWLCLRADEMDNKARDRKQGDD